MRLPKAVREFTSLLQMQERTILDPSSYYPDIDTQLYARQQAQSGLVPSTTIREALGIPAIWRAVSLLATVAASLNLKEYLNQNEIDAAPVVRRPCREWTPGAFTRDSVFYMASRGEAIWLVTERDFTGKASSILPIAPETVKADWNQRRLFNWRTANDETPIPDQDVVHIPFMRDPSTGRGMGPMQMCGVALNVAREADVWASRFYVGSVPSLFLDSESPISEEESTRVKEQWLKDPPNVPKVGYGFDPKSIGFDAEQAQMLQARMHNRGEAAVMFGIPGKMLEYAESGSSLTYTNVGGLATELVRLTLAPGYLEQIEQAFSDLRPVGHEVRYDVAGFERADVKTRYDIHKTAIETGVYDAEYAARQEGIEGGSPEVVPAPLRRVG